MIEHIYLAHHGIKGMKWGVRRFRNEDGSLTEAGKARAQKNANRNADKAKREDYRRASKNRRNLSDAELKRRINRLQMEKQLKDLTDANLQSRGRRAVEEVLGSSGKRVAGIMLAGATMYAGHAILTGMFDAEQAAAYIFANPNKKK